MTFVISVFILFMQFLWKWVDELVGKGLEWNIVAELFFFAAIASVPLALPMAVLLSSLMTFGNLAEHYELASMKSSGLSLIRIMRPLLLFTCFVTIGAYLFSNYVLPVTNLEMLSTLFDIRQQKPALNIKEGVFYNDIEGYSIRTRKIGEDGQTMQDVMIYDHTGPGGNTMLTVAEYGRMSMTDDKRFLVIELRNGKMYQEMYDQENAAITRPFMRMAFKDQVLRLDLSGFEMQRTDKDLFKDNQAMLNGDQLLAYIDTMNTEIENDKRNFFPALKNAYLNKTAKYWSTTDTLKKPLKTGYFMDELKKEERLKVYDLALNSVRNCKSAAESKVNEIDSEIKGVLRFKIEFWKKYTFSVACLLMFFIGAPLGAIIRKGGLGMPVVVSVVFFIVFWVFSIIGEKLSKEGSLPPEIGMWLGCFILLPLGIWLTRKATADSAMFDSTGFVQRLLRIARFRKKQKAATGIPGEFPQP